MFIRRKRPVPKSLSYSHAYPSVPMWSGQVFSVALLLLLTGRRNLLAITRDGHCETLPSVEVSARGFSLSGSIFQLVPDRLPGSPFVVFRNHTPYGYCLRAHLDWTPNYINITLACDCPESAEEVAPFVPDVLPAMPVPHQTHLQLVYARTGKFAVVYGCYEHGNNSVSEGMLVVGSTVRHLEDYLRLYQTTVYAPLWPQHKRLHESTLPYTMNYSRNAPLACNYRHEFYRNLGLTKANVTLLTVMVLMALVFFFSQCVRFCLRRFASHKLIRC